MYGSEERGSYKVYPKCSFLSDFIASKKEAETQASEARRFLEEAEEYLLSTEQEK